MLLTKIVDKKKEILFSPESIALFFQAHLGQLKRQEQGNSPSQRKFILIFFQEKFTKIDLYQFFC